LAELILWRWLCYWKQSTDSVNPPESPNDILHRNRKINPKIHLKI
jgi:hypothetical protein